MDLVYKISVGLRYTDVISDKKVLAGLAPKISVPQNYDLLSAGYLLQELQTGKTAKLNPITLVAMEVEYANKKFNNDPTVRDEVKTVLELDPFPGSSEDEKLTRLQNGGITEKDYVLSSNIYTFVRRAVEDKKGFLQMKLTEKKKIVEAYAADIVKANSVANAILDPNPNPNPDPAA
jgi:hypothetical protein